jgi:hypothetical protein
MSGRYPLRIFTLYRCYDCVKDLVEFMKAVPTHLKDKVAGILEDIQNSPSVDSYKHKVQISKLVLNLFS